MNTQTGKSHDGRYGTAGTAGERGLPFTANYVSAPRLTCGTYKFGKIQILPRNNQGEQKEKKPEKLLGNLPNFFWAHSPPTWQTHKETQPASLWLFSLSLGMPWRDNGFPNLWPWDDQTVLELELLLYPKISDFKNIFLIQKTFLTTKIFQ